MISYTNQLINKIKSGTDKETVKYTGESGKQFADWQVGEIIRLVMGGSCIGQELDKEREVSKGNPSHEQNEWKFYNRLRRVAYKIFRNDCRGFANIPFILICTS